MGDKELVSFGNYLLSDERNKFISEHVRNTVHHSDLENWKDKTDAGASELYLAIGKLASGKPFRYVDTAVDMPSFAKYINEIYPDFDVDAIVAV